MKKSNPKEIVAILIAILLTLALSTVIFAEMTIKNTFQLETGKIEVEYSSEKDILTVRYSGDKEEEQYQLQFTTMAERMGLLIEVNGSRIEYSLEFLKEDEQLQLDDLEEENYQRKMDINLPGWSIIIVEGIEVQ